MCNWDRDAIGLDAQDCLQPRHGPFHVPNYPFSKDRLNSLKRRSAESVTHGMKGNYSAGIRRR